MTEGSPSEGCCARRCFRLPTAGCIEAKREAQSVYQDVGRMWKRVQIKKRLSKMCSVDNAKRFLPISIWIRHYKLRYLWGDFIAGLTIGLTVIPQGLAQSSGIANLRPEYGLYSAFVGVILYAFFGTGRDCSLGPTAVASLLVSEYGAGFIPRDGTVAVALCLMTGVIQLAMGIFRIGLIADYISVPVISGFTTAAGITIAFGQFKNWLGLKGIPSNVFSGMVAILSKVPQIKWADFGMGLTCMILLYWLKKLKDIKYDKTVEVSTCTKVLRKTLWYIAIGRNVCLVLLTSILTKVLTIYSKNPFTLTGHIPAGMPPIRVPPFHQNVTVNATANIYEYYGPSDFFDRMGAGLIVVPLLGIVENIAIGKEFGRKNGYKLDQEQEVIALGICNTVGSFFSSYSVTASFSRSALLAQSGSRSPLNGIVTGATVLLALGVLTPACYFIPTPCLAAVIIMACPDLINFAIGCSMWKRSKLDLLPWIATVAVGLATSIEYGLFAGIGLSTLYLLYPWSRQKIHIASKNTRNYSLSESSENYDEEPRDEDLIPMLKFSGGMMYPGVEIMRDEIMFQAGKGKSPGQASSPVILDFTHINYVDFTAIECFEELAKDLHKHNSKMVFTNVKPRILESLQDAKIPHFVYYNTTDEAVQALRETVKQNGQSQAYLETRDNLGYKYSPTSSPSFYHRRKTAIQANGSTKNEKPWWSQRWYDVLANEMADELFVSEETKKQQKFDNKFLKASTSGIELVDDEYI